MKVDINKGGVLIITSESELESYALGRWIDSNWVYVESTKEFKINVEKIHIDHSFIINEYPLATKGQ